MHPEVSEEAAAEVRARWEKSDLPEGTSATIAQLARRLLQGFFPPLDLAGINDAKTGETLGVHLGRVCVPALLVSYHIGYDLAVGRLSREDGARYLNAATRIVDLLSDS
jgi:hypothetical protein